MTPSFTNPTHSQPWGEQALVSPAESSSEPAASPLSDVCGIVLAGAYHWRDGPFERLLRSPTLPVAQTPIICYPLLWLASGGVRDAIVCASGATTAVRRLIGDGSGLGVRLRYHDDRQPRGPAGCARDAARLVDASTFVVVEGSMVPSLDLAAVIAAHRRAGAGATTVVELDRRRGAVGTRRRPTPGGIYVFERRVLDDVASVGYQDIKQGLLERLYARGETVLAHHVAGVAPRILDAATYAAVNGWMIGAAADRPDLLPDYDRVGDGRHHATAVVHPDARIIGPAILGPGVRVDADAVIVGPTSIGAGTRIGEGAIVARSNVWERCTVNRSARLDASLLGHEMVVSAGERLFGVVHLGPLGEARPGGGGIAPAGGKPPVRLPADFALPIARQGRQSAASRARG